MDASILIVEDENRLRKNLAAYLASEGFTVQQAANARDARDVLQIVPFTVAVVDLGLPDADGFELLEEIQAREGRIGTIVITGQPSVENELRALRLGASAFLPKPVSCRQLKDAIAGIREGLVGVGMSRAHERDHAHR